MTQIDADRIGRPAGRGSTYRHLGGYLLVTLVASPANLLLYWGFLCLEWAPGIANLSAGSLVVLPTFFSFRRWVWGLSGQASVRREIAPFWLFSVVNVGLSTLVAARLAGFGLADHQLVAATVGVYTVTWFVRFTWLDRFLFRR
jgi:putative flippase GtrA